MEAALGASVWREKVGRLEGLATTLFLGEEMLLGQTGYGEGLVAWANWGMPGEVK